MITQTLNFPKAVCQAPIKGQVSLKNGFVNIFKSCFIVGAFSKKLLISSTPEQSFATIACW
jgi:hypothetical protein